MPFLIKHPFRFNAPSTDAKKEINTWMFNQENTVCECVKAMAIRPVCFAEIAKQPLRNFIPGMIILLRQVGQYILK